MSLRLFSCGSSILVEFDGWFFVREGKSENPKKNPWGKARSKNKLNPHTAPAGNRTQAISVVGEYSHNCDIPCRRFSLYPGK